MWMLFVFIFIVLYIMISVLLEFRRYNKRKENSRLIDIVIKRRVRYDIDDGIIRENFKIID